LRKLEAVILNPLDKAKHFVSQRIVLKFKADTHIQDLLHTSGILYAGGAVALILLIIQQFALARLLGPSEYGRLAIIISSGLLALLFLDFRTWELGIKLLTTEIANQAPVEVVRVINWLVAIEVVTGLLGAGLLFVFAEPLGIHILNVPGFEWLIRLYAFSLPFRMVADGVTSTVPRVYNNFKWVAYKTVSNNFFRLVIMLALVLMGYGLSGAVIGAVISDIVNFIVVTVIAWRILKREMPGLRLWDRTRPRQQVAGYRIIGDYWVVSSLAGLNQQAIFPFLGLLTSTAQVGLFRVALDIAQFLDRLVAPLNLGAAPQIMRVYAQHDWKTFTSYLKRTALLFCAAVTPLILAIIILGPFVFPRILQDENYALLPIVAAITSIGYAINMATIPWVRPALIAVGHSRIQSIAIFFQSLMMFVMVWWLAPRYGALGAAIGMGVSMGILSLFLLFFWIYVSKRQHQLQKIDTSS